jgi:hypothetical protein
MLIRHTIDALSEQSTALEGRRAVFERGPLPCYPLKMRTFARATNSLLLPPGKDSGAQPGKIGYQE